MGRLDRRIAALEARRPPPGLVDMLATAYGRPDWFEAALADDETRDMLAAFVDTASGQRFASRLSDPFERAIADMLDCDGVDPERHRGTIPDRIIAAVYNCRRNYANASLRAAPARGRG